MNKGEHVIYKGEVYIYDGYESKGCYEDRDLEQWDKLRRKDGSVFKVRCRVNSEVISLSSLEYKLSLANEKVKREKEERDEIKKKIDFIQMKIKEYKKED